MADDLTLATKIETGETLFDFIRRCGRIKPEHWNGYSCSRELYEKLVTPALVAHLLEGAAHLLIQADAARAQGPSTSGAYELKLDETIARSSPGGVVDYSTFEALEEALDKADAPITEGGRFLTLVERVNAILARAQGPGEAVADGWVMVPREPTPEMKSAAWDAYSPITQSKIGTVAMMTNVYRAMIAATPTREA